MARDAGAGQAAAAPALHHVAQPSRTALLRRGAAAPVRLAALPWRWLARGSLSTRLVASLVLLVALTCAVVGVATYMVLHKSLLDTLNTQLQAASGRYYAACLEHGGMPSSGLPQLHGTAYSFYGSGATNPPDENQLGCGAITGQAAGTFGARLKNGDVTNQAIVMGQSHLSAADKTALQALPIYHVPPSGPFNPPTYTRDLHSIGGDFRLTAIRGDDGDTLITGLSMKSTDRTLGDVEMAEGILFAIIVVLAWCIGTGLVRLSLGPLRRVAATATLVTQLPLDTGEVAMPPHVPDDNPRTEVGQVGAAFNRMLRHVESALARRAASEARLRRFAADASHELRTPLSAICGYVELALRHRGPVPKEVTHALRRVESESARMSVLVDELLLLARLDAGRPLAQEPVDLTRLAIDAASDARAASPTHRWQLELPDVPLMVRGDEHRLRQVLANLLSNAGKHTPAGATVTVAMAATTYSPGTAGRAPSTGTGNGSGEEEHPADAAPASSRSGRPRGSSAPAPIPAVQLSVTDDGPGVPADILPDLFERFVRGDSSRSHAAGSTGLGLAIVKAVVTAHQGTVSVTSRPGRTSFTIMLPRLQESPDAGEPPWPEHPKASATDSLS
jgi:two-component system OmpR family sensor kinase